MRIDLHVHSSWVSQKDEAVVSPEELMNRLHQAGLDACVVLSHSAIPSIEHEPMSARERIDRVMEFTKDHEELIPFFFIDPTEGDAVEQVDYAVKAGIRGFKIICNHFFPNDPRAIPVYHRIAQADKPLLFHSGILYDGKNASSNYNRPVNFEVLLSVPNLRFALAHISWPWCDECIALYGKAAHHRRYHTDSNPAEMFVDITPGTPKAYRKDALSKLLDMDEAKTHVMWGSDNCVNTYQASYSQYIRDMDEEIVADLGLGDDFLADLYANNFMRFLNGSKK